MFRFLSQIAGFGVHHVDEWLSRQDGIAERLRDLRVQAGLSGKEIAASTGWQQSKVSRLEKGKQFPSADDIRLWVKVCGCDSELALDLIDQTAEARAGYRDWQRRRARLGAAEIQAGYNLLFQHSRRICHFELTLVPGPLQTADYARRVLADEAAVAVRLQRQQYLYDLAKQFEFLLAEPVLRWLFCPAEVMRGQLDRLQTVIGLPNVRFGILPMNSPLEECPANSFQLLDDLVTVETLVGEWTHREDESVVYASALKRMWEDAVTGEPARELIIAAAKALPTSSS